MDPWVQVMIVLYHTNMIMEVENGGLEDNFSLQGDHFPLNHDYGRKSKMKGNSYWRYTHFPLNHDYGRKGIPYQHDYKHHPIWKKLRKAGHDILLYLFEQLVWTFIMTFLGFCVAC